MEEFLTAHFWLAVGQIILIDILLGGDNAVVIALACRGLPAKQRTKGILWGTVGAIALRVVLIAFALSLLQVPYLKLVGAILLLWIGVKLLAPAPGHLEACGACFAQCRDGRGPEEIALKVLIGTKLLEVVGHNRFLTGGSSQSGRDPVSWLPFAQATQCPD